MPSPNDRIPEEWKRAAAAEPDRTLKTGDFAPEEKNALPPGDHPQRRLFKRRRGGQVLSREQVKEIKAGRKKLRADMRRQGVRSKKQFELVAASLGLYFDKRRGLLFWLLKGKGLLMLLGAALLLLLALFLMSLFSQMRGYFTINLSNGMFKEGFVLSETADFANPSVALYCEPAVDVPCISIVQIEEDVNDAYEGQHNSDYFAYTFFLRNEGENTVDYVWSLGLTDESKKLSTACWVMVFEDGEMRFFAERNGETGKAERIPGEENPTRGYTRTPLISQALNPGDQYEVITQRGNLKYYRLIPYPFEGKDVVTTGGRSAVEPFDVHKYTVVIWVEGDDPDANDSKIGGHLGLDMQFELVGEGGAAGGDEGNRQSSIWDNLRFWD
ncbi:MAG: hypothetical protein K6G17_05570 [Oscillospiraceae bacterium]|nr:hypothetical protein [Oscillospiraceae bacterium]